MVVEQNIYERHIYKDHGLPIIFNEYETSYKRYYFHWHENLELLCFTKGRATVFSNAKQIEAEAGDIAVVNSNCIHDVQVSQGPMKYYCLIIDKDFCENFGFQIEEITFRQKIHAPQLAECFEKIKEELKEKSPFYKEAVKLQILQLLLTLSRNYQEKEDSTFRTSGKVGMVKNSMKYIKMHFNDHITLDMVASYVGFSKYYFCRAFKDVTGYTVNSYINFLRANYAYELIREKRYSLGEVAVKSGFESLSYFTKNFKKYIGELPSKVN